MSRHDRWNVAVVATLVSGLLGVLTNSATVVAAALVPLSFAAYGHAARPPATDVEVTREVSDTEPSPGDHVTVTVTVRNASERPLAEVRVVDEPPTDMALVGGTPAHCTSLGIDESETFEYTLLAHRGTHAFCGASVLVRNVSGTVEHHQLIERSTEVTCRIAIDDLPLPPQTTVHEGRVDADAAGDGVAFHSVREYEPADPLHRIDWKRLARTNELSTVQFQETRAAAVVLLVDTRFRARPGRYPTEHDAAEYCAFVADRIADRLLALGNRVGATIYGDSLYLRPGVGRDQRERVRRFLAPDIDETVTLDDGAFVGDGTTVSHGRFLTLLEQRLSTNAQVIFCSPLLDDRAAATVRELVARGHAVTVLSPDVTATDRPGAVVERVRRRQRVRDLQTDARVVEWTPEESLAAAISRATARWSA